MRETHHDRYRNGAFHVPYGKKYARYALPRKEAAMSIRPFRFIHASDFHLERPLMGVTEVPDHLRELFLEAPYTAAKQVFDAALAEEADFVVLPGGILNPTEAGPRGPLFLAAQFARLSRTRDWDLLGRFAD